ncbi:MAG: hypothetical protein K2J10_10175 [Muribaculaceae bacterium]|nr:hypothetical protein [Muribaculaceae bacterium]
MTSCLRIFSALLLIAATLGCTEKQPNNVAIPKPTAYPRVNDPGSEYIAVDRLPVVLLANAAATVTRPRPQWLDITYPGLDVTLHVSLTPTTPAEINHVIANRSERMALNVADVSSTGETQLNSPDFSSVLITSPETRSTPLQFLAHDGDGLVISGAAFFSSVTPDASIDSLSPIVSYIERDIIHALSNLTHK